MMGKFKFDTIMGLANNRIRATGQDGDRSGQALAGAGILFVAECGYNVDGVLVGWAGHIVRKEASFAKIMPCREARRVDKTPSELVYAKVENVIYPGIPFGELLYAGGVDVI